MPYTTCSKVTLRQAGGTPNHSFYLADILAVANQPGCTRTAVYTAVLSNGSSNTEFSVMVGLDAEMNLLTEADHLAALACPPFDIDAGKFIADPVLL